MYVNTHRLQRGLSLVEVFVALLVLSVGLIALAKLQVDLVRSGSDARARTIALNLAEEKIEDLRTFATVDDPGAVSWSTAASPMDWTYIDDNTGGRLPPQTTFSSALEVAGVRFLRTWDVTDRDFTNVASGITSRTKDVTVTVSWQSETGESQPGCPVANTRCVQTIANVVEIPPGNVVQASEPLSERPDGPQIVYTPGEAPDVISVPIDTGTGKRETTKPLPDVQAQGDYTHEVRFDVVNYHLEDGQNVVDRREEFVTVNCRCALNGPGLGRTPARVAFTGTILRDAPGQEIEKSQTGVVDGPSQQPVLCDICCRDHHDEPLDEPLPDGSIYRYKNPFDAAAAGATPHQHYLYDPNANDFELASSVGDPYDEACRLKRVNGVFQVFQDWRLETLTVLPPGYLDDSTLNSYSQYTSYVQQFVQELARTNGSPPSKESVMTESRDFVVDVNDQTFARALYVDYVPANLRTFIDARLEGSPPKPVLEFIPFYEINLTKLADWDLAMSNGDPQIPPNDGLNCPPSADPADIPGAMCVTNEEILDEGIGAPTYSRGVVFAGAEAGTRRVRATVKAANTGITGTLPISVVDETARDDFVLADVVGTPGIGGTFTFCSDVVPGNKKKLVQQVAIGVSGASGTPACFADDTSFVWRCEPIVEGETVTVAFSDSDTARPPLFASPSSTIVTSPSSSVAVELCDHP